MAEYTARDLLAANLLRHMEETPALDSPEKLSKRCFWPAGAKKGKRVAPRTIRYVLETESKTDKPTPSPSLDLIVALATAFEVQPWEMLVDDDQARKWVMARILIGKTAPDSVVEKNYHTPAPQSPAKKRATAHVAKKGGE